MRLVIFLSVVLGLAGSAFAQEYDILLKGGHVLDARNAVSAVRDVAIKDGKIAAVAENIPAARALKTVDVAGLYVTPGLIDIHGHVYRPTFGQPLPQGTSEAAGQHGRTSIAHNSVGDDGRPVHWQRMPIVKER